MGGGRGAFGADGGLSRSAASGGGYVYVSVHVQLVSVCSTDVPDAFTSATSMPAVPPVFIMVTETQWRPCATGTT